VMLTEAFVAGLTKANARRLLDRAKELGLPSSVVRTVDSGFIVPAVLLEEESPRVTVTHPDPVPEPVVEPESEPEVKPKRTYQRKSNYSRKSGSSYQRKNSKSQSADLTTADAVASEE
jgi:hypothetical protein